MSSARGESRIITLNHISPRIQRTVLTAALLFLTNRALPQEVLIRGSFICPENENNSTQRTAKFIVVLPAQRPDLVSISNEIGFFQINLSNKEAKKLRDRSLDLVCISKFDTIATHTLYLSQEDIFERRKNLGEIRLNSVCNRIDQSYSEARRTVDSLRKSERVKAKSDNTSWYYTVASVTVSAAGILRLAPALAPPPTSDTISSIVEPRNLKNVSLSPQQFDPGSFLDRLYDNYSQNSGFAFSPLRNLSESIFWNPSASVFAVDNEIALLTDYKRFFRGTFVHPIDDRFSCGLGVYYLHLEEQRTISFDSLMDSKELVSGQVLGAASVSALITDEASVGFSMNYIYQDVELPSGAQIITKFRSGSIVSRSATLLTRHMNAHNLDFSLSATLQPIPNLRIGFSLQNILNTPLLRGDRSASSSASLGLGTTFQSGRLHVGFSTRLLRCSRMQYSLGLDYVPMDLFSASLGFSAIDKVISLGVNYSNIFYTLKTSSTDRVHHLLGGRFVF